MPHRLRNTYLIHLPHFYSESVYRILYISAYASCDWTEVLLWLTSKRCKISLLKTGYLSAWKHTNLFCSNACTYCLNTLTTTYILSPHRHRLNFKPVCPCRIGIQQNGTTKSFSQSRSVFLCQYNFIHMLLHSHFIHLPLMILYCSN